MRIPVLGVMFTAFGAFHASAQLTDIDNSGFGGTYFCTSEASGGVRFMENLNSWTGAEFLASQRYVVSVVPHSLVKDEFSGNMRPAYIISVTAHGEETSEADACVSRNVELRKIDRGLNYISVTGEFSCMQFGGEWIMHIENLRFLQSYVWGYVDGRDNNENTPNVEIGTCTKID